MSNHYLTIGLCARALSKGDPDDIDLTPLIGVNLCELLVPQPDALNNIVAYAPLCRYRHKQTGEWHPDINRPGVVDLDDYEAVPLTPAEQADLIREYGAATWYDWRMVHWGTKWGIYGLKVHNLGGDGSPVLIEFQSAWEPPNEEMMGKINRYLLDEYDLADITWVGHNPGNEHTELIPVETVPHK